MEYIVIPGSQYTVEELFNGLGYIFSSPEMQYFHNLILEKKFSEAKGMLLEEEFSDEESDAMISYHYNQENQRVEIEEISLEELVEGEEYIFKNGSRLIHSHVRSFNGILGFFTETEFVSVSRTLQVWRVVVQ